NPSGPHHDSKPALFVQSSQSSATWARYVRSMTSSDLAESAAAGLVWSLMVVDPLAESSLLRWSERNEAWFPARTAVREPLAGFANGCGKVPSSIRPGKGRRARHLFDEGASPFGAVRLPRAAGAHRDGALR